ncbi:MAG: hypothetical protein GWN86_25195 [Desulfobacterales bacterium]|nr:hypothetical protein [Desulfobacterales bacterium]
MPEEMEKILRADDSEVVEIAHGQAPAFYCFETWEGTTHRVILAPPGTTPGQIMHELAHIDLEHDSQERVWFWQKIRQEYEANKLAIEMGAAPEVMAAGMSTYFRPLPDFIRRKIAGFLLDTEVSNKRWEPIDPPVNWVDEWLDYIQE